MELWNFRTWVLILPLHSFFTVVKNSPFYYFHKLSNHSLLMHPVICVDSNAKLIYCFWKVSKKCCENRENPRTVRGCMNLSLRCEIVKIRNYPNTFQPTTCRCYRSVRLQVDEDVVENKRLVFDLRSPPVDEIDFFYGTVL